MTFSLALRSGIRRVWTLFTREKVETTCAEGKKEKKIRKCPSVLLPKKHLEKKERKKILLQDFLPVLFQFELVPKRLTETVSSHKGRLTKSQ